VRRDVNLGDDSGFGYYQIRSVRAVAGDVRNIEAVVSWVASSEVGPCCARNQYRIVVPLVSEWPCSVGHRRVQYWTGSAVQLGIGSRDSHQRRDPCAYDQQIRAAGAVGGSVSNIQAIVS